MSKLKKPNFEKWGKKDGWTWWEAICLLSDIEPPETYDGYLKMKKSSKYLKNREELFKEKGFFKEFGVDPYFIQ